MDGAGDRTQRCPTEVVAKVGVHKGGRKCKSGAETDVVNLATQQRVDFSSVAARRPTIHKGSI